MKAIQNFLEFNPAALNQQHEWERNKHNPFGLSQGRRVRIWCMPIHPHWLWERETRSPFLHRFWKKDRPHFSQLKFVINAQTVVVEKGMMSFFGTMLNNVDHSSQLMIWDQTNCVYQSIWDGPKKKKKRKIEEHLCF